MRESWIDVLKGIGIILVVIGHTSMENPLVKWIYVFHMPLFFALSGYMFGRGRKQYTFVKFTEKRTQSLLLNNLVLIDPSVRRKVSHFIYNCFFYS